MDTVPGFNTWKTERSGTDKGGGGLAILYKDTLPAHQWIPSVPAKFQYIMNERQWLIIDNKTEKCAFLHVYIACQSTRTDSFLQWNEDLFCLLTQEAITLRRQGFIVLAMGDFNTRVGTIPGLEGNTPDTNRNTPMFMNFVTEVNMIIINTLPISKGLFTRYMDNSGLPGTRSLLDYGLIDGDHSNTVTSFVIDDQSRYDCGSDHALLECDMEFGARPKVNWSFHDAIQYNLHDKTDYAEYHTNLDTITSTVRLSTFSTLTADQMLPHISETISQSAMKSFGLKIKKKKRGNKLPRSIINLIKTKNSLAREHHLAVINSNPAEAQRLLEELDTLKTLVKDSISEVRLSRRQRLRTKLLKADPSRKKFWRFLKNQIKSAGNITALNDKTEQMVFDQTEIEEAILQHFETVFQGKRHPVYAPTLLPNQEDLCIAELNQILGQNLPAFQPTQFEDDVCSPYTFLELDQILGKLPSAKSSGYDKISNELLKNASFKFKQYILIFLNKIIEEGVVPQKMNIGKCILIFKVLLFKNPILISPHITLYKFRVVTLLTPHNTDPLRFLQTYCVWLQ